MSSINLYKQICQLLEEERKGVLATIIMTRGSTPVSALSKMVVLDGGANIIGTVGGGCLEAQVITDSKTVYETGIPDIKTYTMTEDDIEGGLICGGTLDILLELLNSAMLPVFKKLLDNCLEGKDAVLGTVLTKDSMSKKFLVTEGEKGTDLPEEIFARTEFKDVAHEVRRTGKTLIYEIGGSKIVLEPVAGVYTVVIFGGGHVSKFVAEAAQRTGFAVCVVDDRAKFASRKRFPTVEQVVCAGFREAFSQLRINEKTYLVIVTRGHSYDEVVLEEALKTPAGYIGMIGSKRKISKTYDNLRERGVGISKLKNVFSPLGLDIGAETAEEIAVSIVAELIKFRHIKHDKSAPHLRDSMRPYFKKNK
ncbi:hypothetical protein AMJ80_05015 [bacterium SM23_31]|nr:MAG: hypothetical protein AMJ80_05015 [bacterium SM23_31]